MPRGLASDGVHWTHRPENKERLKAMLKRAAATRKKNKSSRNQYTKVNIKPEELESGNGKRIEERTEVAWLVGYITARIEIVSSAIDVPFESLAASVSKILSSKSRR